MPRQPLPLEALARLSSVSYLSLDHAGRQLACYSDRTGRNELYVLDLASGATRQLSRGEIPRALRYGFVWSRDDATIVFARDHDGDEQHDLWAFDVASGACMQWTDTPRTQEYPVEFSPDGTTLSLICNRIGQHNLWLMDSASRDAWPLTQFQNSVGGGRWSPDGQWLAITANHTADLRNADGWLIRADGGELRRVFSTEPGVADALVRWHPDGQRLSVSSEVGGYARLGLLNLDDGSVMWLGDGAAEESGGRFSHDGRQLAAVRNQDACLLPRLYDVETGALRELELPPGVAGIVGFTAGDQHVILTHSSPTCRTRVLRYDLATNAADPLIEADHGTLDPAAFVEPEYLVYESTDGLRIPALVYVPRGLAPGERCPAIVNVHGGPAGQYQREFDWLAQHLASKGYVVMLPNIRGSGGYGKVWRELNFLDWGGQDIEDVAAGAAWLAARPEVDPRRLGVMGGSYGGYNTFMQVTRKPDLWKAAVARIGITDLHAMYNESREHFRQFMRLYLGDPVANHDLWRERSAITHAANLKAKLLMMHGATDPRCPVSQSRLFRDRLLELGRVEGEDFVYLESADQGHGSTDPEHRITNFGAAVEWFDRYL